jgi:hypothetical protein
MKIEADKNPRPPDPPDNNQPTTMGDDTTGGGCGLGGHGGDLEADPSQNPPDPNKKPKPPEQKQTYSASETATTSIQANMTRPDDKRAKRYYHYAFDNAMPGVCEITCIANVFPDNNGVRDLLKDKIKWSADTIEGSTLSWKNGKAGPGVGVYSGAGDWKETAIFTTLPSDNSKFGEKRVAFNVDNLGISRQGTTKVFFERDAKNHPGTGTGVTPNWFYYWSQGAVGGGLDDFVYGGDGNIGGRCFLGKYVESTNTLIIYDQAAYQKNSVTVTHKTNSALVFAIGQDAEGIDSVAAVVVHEKKHQWIHHNWSGDEVKDTDGDGVPDSQEGKAPYYFNINDSDTYNLGHVLNSDYYKYGDSEFLCRMEEKNYISNHSKDWAKPGKQWTNAITQY